MRRLTVVLLVLLVVVAAGAAAAYIFLFATDDPMTGSSASTPQPIEDAGGSFLAARDSLLAGPQEVDLLLTVNLPKGAGVDNPDHQEITASGEIDYLAGDAKLAYDFEGLTNAAGLLGHFETLEVIYADGAGYMKVFVSGPRWASIEPEDASNPHVLRLREVMLTTPMILPGLLDATATADAGSGTAPPNEIDAASLANADDEITAGIGSALEEMGADDVTLDVAVEDGNSEVVLAFTYAGDLGGTDVQATYEISRIDEQVSVEAPEPSRIRTFSSIFS